MAQRSERALCKIKEKSLGIRENESQGNLFVLIRAFPKHFRTLGAQSTRDGIKKKYSDDGVKDRAYDARKIAPSKSKTEDLCVLQIIEEPSVKVHNGGVERGNDERGNERDQGNSYGVAFFVFRHSFAEKTRAEAYQKTARKRRDDPKRKRYADAVL